MFRTNRLLPFALLTLLIAGQAAGAVVDDDLTFAGTGTAIKGVANQDFFASGIQPLPGGGVLVAATYDRDKTVSEPVEAVVLAFDANGSPDAGFGTNGMTVIALPNAATAAAAATAIARSSATGDLYVSGHELGSPTRLFLARLDAQGQTLGAAFPQSDEPLTHLLDDIPRGLHVLPSGKVLAVTLATSGGTRWVLIARFNADGGVDTGFGGGDGVLLWRPVEPGTGGGVQLRLFGTARDSAGRVLLMLTAGSSNPDVLVARLDADGQPDPTFRAGGAQALARPVLAGGDPLLVNTSTPRRATFGADPANDQVFVGLESGSNSLVYLLKLNADGSQDLAYGSSGASTGVQARVLNYCGATFTADGSVILAGNQNVNGGALWRFAGWNANGTPLGTNGFFLGTKSGSFQFPNIFASCSTDLRRDDQGRVLLGGYWTRSDLSPSRSEALVARFAAADVAPPPQPGQLRFESATPPAVIEGVGNVTLRVLREAGTEGTVSVGFSLVPETATGGADYGAALPANGTLVFANGVTEQSIVVPILDDTVFEPGAAETFRVELFGATGGATLGVPSTTTVQIIDNDSGFDLALSMDPPDFLSDGVVYRVVVTNQSADPSPPRTVQIEAPPDPLDFLSADSILRPGSTPFGSYQPGIDLWSVPSLLFNQSAELRWTARFTIPADAGGFITFRARISNNADDLDPANDATELALPVGDDLAVSVTSPETSYAAGAFVPFDVRVSRVPIQTPTGTRYASAVLTLDLESVNDVTTNSNTSFAPERTAGATCTAENDFKRLRCNLGDLSPPRLVPIDIRVEGTGTDDHTLRLTASLATTTFDPDLANNAAVTGVSIGEGLVGSPPASYTDLRQDQTDGGFDSPFNGMCFIATAAYGSWMDPHVAELRAFRDRRLLTNAPGRAFVRWYYRVSPPIADWIAERAWARALVRALLTPVVFAVSHPFAALALAASILLLATRRRLGVRRRARAAAVSALVLVVLGASAPSPVTAQDDPRWYAGVAAGLSRVEPYELAVASSLELDDTDTAWTVFGGRRFGRFVAVNVAYVDFGALEASGTVPSGNFTDSVSATAFEVGARLFWSISDRLQIYGGPAYVRWDQTVAQTLAGDQRRLSDTGSTYNLGGGLAVALGDRLKLTFDARRYRAIGNETTTRELRADLATIGVVIALGD